MSSNETGRTPEHWERLQELFSRAADLTDEEQVAFLAHEIGDDERLREELIDLLAADRGKMTSPLTHAVGAALDRTTRDRRKAILGRIINNYRLVSILGHGGTGTVYLAERADRQYSAQVAVKIIDAATVHGDLGQRFRAERQILASLNHANIARLIDAGETDEGQPYLIMEYVHGEPLDKYCDLRELNIRDRLELFLHICSAVHYAHQNLIVHRDLKPANILVTAEASPKLLDFGIAKLLDVGGDAAAVLALTRMNDRLLTPEYASPEQILGRTVTTASDVYALGVVLYELLTGLRPYSVPASASQLELERTICISDPERPSAALKKAVSDASSPESPIVNAAAVRGLSIEKLVRQLTGDLDSIVLRALRKEPQHRYTSVEQLASDIRRHLSREPVLARQGNWTYYTSRFVRRHAFGVSAGAAFAVFLAAFAVVMSIQAQRIAAERDRATIEGARAESVSEFMLDIFEASDPFQARGKEVSARELLDQAGRNIRGDLSQHPEVRARLLEAIGRAYRRQNEFDLSVSFLEEAEHLRRQLPDPDGSRRANTLAELAMSLRDAGDLDGAESALKEAAELSEHNRGVGTLTYAKLLTGLGRVEQAAGDIAAAKSYFERSLSLHRELLGPNHHEVASVLLDLASVHLWEDDLAQAERRTREAVRIYEATMPELYPDRVMADVNLAEILVWQGRVDEASPLLESSLQKQIRLYGPMSRQVAGAYALLSRVRANQGFLEEAEGYARQALSINEKTLGDNHQDTGYSRAALANLLTKRKKLTEAEDQLRRSLATYEQTLPPDHPYVASSEHLLGEVLLHKRELNDAEALLTAAMNRWKRTNSPAWRAARSESALGEVLYLQGRNAEAEQHLTQAYKILAADEGADRDARIAARERVERFYTARGQRERLEELLLATRNSQPSRRQSSNR